MNESTLHPAVSIGHVHLRVADLDRALTFYRDVLGFTVTGDGRPMGMQAAFLAAGGYHHHIALNTWLSKGGTPPPAGHTGLHHVAILYPDRHELARAVQRLYDHNYPIDSAEDHRVTVSVYLNDPTAMASSCITTARASIGSTHRATRSSRRIGSIRATCCPS